MRDIQYMIDVMTAARDGKKIEFRGKGEGLYKFDWEPCSIRVWNWDCLDYRIAPESRKAREFVVWIDEAHRGVRTALEDAHCLRCSGVEYVFVREVLPEDDK